MLTLFICYEFGIYFKLLLKLITIGTSANCKYGNTANSSVRSTNFFEKLLVCLLA